MRILLLYNPIAGAGRSSAEACRLADVLRRHGYDVDVVETQVAPTRDWVDEPMRRADLAVAMGGDGAMRLVADAALRADRPVYHYPLGTENLIAREFGQRRDTEQLLYAIDRFKVREIDVGDANGRPFLLMASVGVDAEVVHDLSSRRGRSISHFSYLLPMAHQLLRWRPPILSVEVDGVEVVSPSPGCVIVANSRQYAMRLNPARGASMSDGLLDVLYFPAPSRLSLLTWIARLRSGRHLENSELVYRQGRAAAIRLNEPRRYQLDGDPPDPAADASKGAGAGSWTTLLTIGLQPRRLAILLP